MYLTTLSGQYNCVGSYSLSGSTSQIAETSNEALNVPDGKTDLLEFKN